MYEVIHVSKIPVGVVFSKKVDSGIYHTKVCETLFDTGNDEKDAAESLHWAGVISDALNARRHFIINGGDWMSTIFRSHNTPDGYKYITVYEDCEHDIILNTCFEEDLKAKYPDEFDSIIKYFNHEKDYPGPVGKHNHW